MLPAPNTENASVCGAGFVPGDALNVRLGGETKITRPEITFNVTLTVTALLVPDATDTVPVYVPTPSDPLFTITLTLPGVVPPVGATLSPLPPLLVVATAMVWIFGGEPPGTASNVNCDGVADNPTAVPGFTVRFTFTLCGELVAKFEDTVTFPVYVPAAKPARLTLTGKFSEVDPLSCSDPAFITLSQGPPDVVVGVSE